MSACDRFRQHLEGALVGRPDPAALRALGWHEHLFTCEDCRALLDGEEALEHLLDALPHVTLPRELAARVLARLRAAGVAAPGDPGVEERALDRVLSRQPEPAVPADLGARVLAGVRARRADEALDRLLARVEAEPAPRALAARVLAALEPERAARTQLVALELRWTYAAAALALLALGVWIVGGGPGDDARSAEELAAVPADDVDPELLAALDVLENWELLMSTDVDVALGVVEPTPLYELDGVGDGAAGASPQDPGAGEDGR